MRDNFSDTTSRSQIVISLTFVVLVVCFCFYLPLMLEVPTRAASIHYFRTFIFPIAVSHIGTCLLIVLIFPQKVRWIFGFWLLSLLLILFLGGISPVVAFSVFLIFALCLFEIGGVLARAVLGKDSQSLGLSLGFGILATSLLGSYLASFHLLRFEILAILLLTFLIISWLKKQFVFLQHLKILKEQLRANWNISTVIAMEGLFLLCAYLIVDSTAPENVSDSVRFYWPYIKLLANHSGFFDNPYQWSYVIPQAGLAYAGPVFVLLGPLVVRWSMFLVWTTVVGLIIRGKVDTDLGLKLSIAIVLASSPILLRLSGTLMQDVFVCLVVLALAIICIEAKDPQSPKLFFVIGLIVGLAWSSKFSTLVYAVPVMLYLLYRVFKITGLIDTVKRAVIIPTGFVVGAGPWLWRSYKHTENPFFPLFSSFFNSNLWPRGFNLGNLETFRLPEGLKGWIAWPIELTYNTHLYVEGYDGALGLVLPFLLVLLVPSIYKTRSSTRAFIAAAILGTFLLWTKTIYIRYWLPGLCLLAVAAVPAVIFLFRNHSKWKFTFCIFSVVICLSHIPFEMLMSFTDPVGFPFDLYSKRISEAQYIERSYPGFQKFQQHLSESKEKFPRIWFTDYEGAGHLDVEPMEAVIWELSRHGLDHPREWIEYLHSKGCKYWIVNKESGQAVWFQSLGLSPFLWPSKNEVASKGTTLMYRMQTLQQALKIYDSRTVPGTDLLINGGFEEYKEPVRKHWSLEGSAQWSSTGISSVRLNPGSGLSQTIPLPPSLKKILVTINSKRLTSFEDPTLTVSLLWKEPDSRIFHQDKSIFTVGVDWKTEKMVRNVPSKAAWVELYVYHSGGNALILVDEVHMYAQ